jgi:hypothetical protein
MQGCRMGAGGVLSGPDPLLRAEIVHFSARTRVTRLFLPGGTVVRLLPAWRRSYGTRVSLGLRVATAGPEG